MHLLKILHVFTTKLILIGMSYESKKNAHVQHHLGVFFINIYSYNKNQENYDKNSKESLLSHFSFTFSRHHIFSLTFLKKSGTLREKLTYTFIRRGKNKKKWHNCAPDTIYILRQQDLSFSFGTLNLCLAGMGSHFSLLRTFGFSATSTYNSYLPLIFGKFALI